MTGGEHVHGTDCTEALLRAYEYIDGEMGALDSAKIQAHLDECERCLQQYELEKTLKALIRRSCAGESAPAQLRLTILARITTIRVDPGAAGAESG